MGETSTHRESATLRAFSGFAFPGHWLDLFAGSGTPWNRGDDEGMEGIRNSNYTRRT